MSKIKNGGLDQYGPEPFEQQQFGTAGVDGVKGPLFGLTRFHRNYTYRTKAIYFPAVS